MDNQKKIIIGAAAGALLLYFLFRKKKDDKTGGTSEQDVVINKKNLTYDDIAYKGFADGIEAAIWGTGGVVSWNEDDELVGVILQRMYTIDDVKALIKAYGQRFRGMLLKDGGNLVATIAEYLDDDVKDEVNITYEQRGINFFW